MPCFKLYLAHVVITSSHFMYCSRHHILRTVHASHLIFKHIPTGKKHFPNTFPPQGSHTFKKTFSILLQNLSILNEKSSTPSLVFIFPKSWWWNTILDIAYHCRKHLLLQTKIVTNKIVDSFKPHLPLVMSQYASHLDFASHQRKEELGQERGVRANQFRFFLPFRLAAQTAGNEVGVWRHNFCYAVDNGLLQFRQKHLHRQRRRVTYDVRRTDSATE